MRLAALRGHFFEKIKQNRCAPRERVYRIGGFFRFLFGQGVVYKQTDTPTDIRQNIGIPSAYTRHVDSTLQY